MPMETKEEAQAFKMLALCNSDRFPDAHVCRLKVSFVTIDSPVECPWDVTKEFHAYSVKLGHTSSSCRLSRSSELYLLRSAVTSFTDPRFTAIESPYTELDVAYAHNRQSFLRAIEAGEPTAQYILPPRKVDSGWPARFRTEALNADVPDAWARNVSSRKMIPKVYQVSGAGMAEVNGLYEFDGKRDGVPMWRNGSIILARFGGEHGLGSWFISKDTSMMWGHDDLSNSGDYYMGPRDANGKQPPLEGCPIPKHSQTYV